MTWDQIREISKEDFVEIGNHSHTHEYLADESNELIKRRYCKINLYFNKNLKKKF
jgi:peptidoglycan/xylan/chitin deacetylase (PgdA/CDA1 family)